MIAKRHLYAMLTYFGFTLFFGMLGIQFLLINFSAIDHKYIPMIANILSFSIGLLYILMLMAPDFRLEKETSTTTVPQIIGWSILGLIMAFVSQAIAANIEIHLLGIEPGSENTEQIIEIMKLSPFFMIVPALIGPILEELIFRKIIYGGLAKKMNVFFAAIISSAIFSVIHNDLSHFLIYFAMGLVFVFLYAKTKRIIVPIIAHMGMNALVLVIQSLVDLEELQKILDEINEGLIFFFL